MGGGGLELLGPRIMQMEEGQRIERQSLCSQVHTALPLLVPQLLWPADAERKQQCGFKGKDPEVSQHPEVTWAEGGLEVVGLGPGWRLEAGVDAASCGGKDMGF